MGLSESYQVCRGDGFFILASGSSLHDTVLGQLNIDTPVLVHNASLSILMSSWLFCNSGWVLMTPASFDLSVDDVPPTLLVFFQDIDFTLHRIYEYIVCPPSI